MSRTFQRALFSALWYAGLAQAAPYPNTSNFGVPYSQGESWYRQCMRVEQRSAPGLRQKIPTPNCRADQLYYDKRGQPTTSAREWRQVHACALAQGDDAVLMMLYANGFGVPKDRDIAIHHACKLEFIAKAEMEARIAHLSEPQHQGAVFDQCDDITSGHMGTVCAGIREGQAERSRKAGLADLARRLPPPARRAFTQLQAAAGRYARASETDMQGTAAPGLAIAREGKRQAQFADTLARVRDRTLPHASPRDLARVDRELNRVYRMLMSAEPSQAGQPERIGSSTITRTEVREAERHWIAYRDAFLAFRAQLSSSASREALAAELTKQRLAELKRILAYR